MILSLNKANSIGEAYRNSGPVKRGKVELKAIKLRALAVLTDLQVPSLFYDKHFKALLNFLKLDGKYPDSGPELLGLLKNYLPKDLQNDPIVAYMFPWVVFEIFVLKTESLQWIVEDPLKDKIIEEKTNKSCRNH